VSDLQKASEASGQDVQVLSDFVSTRMEAKNDIGREFRMEGISIDGGRRQLTVSGHGLDSSGVL